MKKYFAQLGKTALFKGIAEEDLSALLECLGGNVRQYSRGEAALRAGDRPEQIGVVLEGVLHIVREDIDGGRAIIAAAGPGELFGEALCCAGVEDSPVTVAAESASAVLLLPYSRLARPCVGACGFHARLIENILGIMARRNLFLQSRLEIMGRKTIRERVMGYLEPLAGGRGREIEVPFNREGMADFLSVERSALSHELSRMKREGLLEYCGRRFKLL